jgi:hypothetical protein
MRLILFAILLSGCTTTQKCDLVDLLTEDPKPIEIQP